jgi:hypothetical protein
MVYLADNLTDIFPKRPDSPTRPFALRKCGPHENDITQLDGCT